MKNGLFSAASWSLTAQIGFYGLQWMNMIILARLSGPEAVGLYTLGLAISNPIMALASLMLRTTYVTDQHNRWSFATYNKIRWITLPIGVLAIFGAGLALGYRDLPLIVILLAASWKMAEMLSDLSYAIPHKKGNMRTIARSMIGRAGLSSIILIFILSVTERLDLALLGFSLSWWAYFVLHDNRLEHEAEISQTNEPAISLVKFTLPMALSATVIYFTFSVPRIILDQYENTETLGIFAAISHLLLIGALVVNALGAAITPRLSRYFVRGDHFNYYREVALAVLAATLISSGFIFVAYFAGDQIITLIYGRAISGHSDLVLAISVSSLPLYIGSIIGFVPPALQAYRLHLKINIITLIGTTIAAFWFVSEIGIMGAVYAIFVQGILQLLNAVILLRRPHDITKDNEPLALGEAKA